MEDTLAVVRRLTAEAYALAAVAARVRLDELGVQGDPQVRAQIDRITQHLELGDLDGLTPPVRANLLAGVRANLRQALELVESPEGEASWSHVDPVLLQSQGQASAGVAALFIGAGLGRADARILDVGTGVAGLAMAFCRAYPAATVVGIDPWPPALELARANVAEAGLGSRISLVQSTIEDLNDAAGFDLVWFPSTFIPEAVLDASLRAVHRLTRTGAEVVIAVFEHPENQLASATERLKTARAGGSLLSVEDAIERAGRAGFVDAHLVAVTWPGPMRLIVARRA